MITNISIENFKGIGSRVRVPLKPITLLFGPNSAGKSTIIQAILYAFEVMIRHNADADHALLGGDVVDLGGFRNLVNGRDAQKSVTLRFDFDLSGSEFLPDVAQRPDEDPVAEVGMDVLDEVLRGWVSIEVGWSERRVRPYVQVYRAGLDEMEVGSLISAPDSSGSTLSINVRHPHLRGAHPAGANEGLPEEASAIEALCERLVGRAMIADGILTLPVEKGFEALPDFDGPFVCPTLTDELGADEQRSARGLIAIVSRALIGPGAAVRDELRKMRYVGPLRELPARNYQLPRSPDPSRWAGGLGAWDFLHAADEAYLRRLNAWLNHETRLNIGYTIEQRVAFVADDLIRRTVKANESFELEMEGHFDSLVLSDSGPRVFLLDDGGTRMHPYDVGIGISQIIPVVVAVLAPGSNFVAIEQPELHVHPRLQVGLGDLLIEAATGADDGGRLLLIETHSEHLLLRLLRRIRETAAQNLPPGAVGLHPDQLAVIYINKSEAGTTAEELRIDDNGEFIDRWPGGFFDERGEELF